MTRATLLNVDDHEPGRYARSRLLTEAGYMVEEVGTGAGALHLVDQLRPSLILLDVHLPDISGLEVCRRIRQNSEHANIPILQISACAVANPQRVTGLDNGADAYLVEPVDSDVLLATVRALLRMRHAEQELQRVNEALQASNAALEKANEALMVSNEDLRQYSYLASHDLQEPLRTIRCFATLLGEELAPLGEYYPVNEYLSHIEGASARMSSLITDLLIYAQASEQTASFTDHVEIAEVIQVTKANLEQSLHECSAQVIEDEMPVLPGDKVLLIQLFQNLIGNAVKYRSPERAPVIRIGAQRSGNCWIFSVRDNGMGIDAEYLQMIFDAFKRLHGKELPGTGIGLAICRRIVERHGGRIWAESPGAGAGSTFFFTLGPE